MAAINPPLHLNAGSHGAAGDRRFTHLLFDGRQGVAGSGDLLVEAQSSPNMTVKVAAGRAVINGTQNALQGSYQVENDASVNLTISASHPTNARRDLIVARVIDTEYGGGSDAWSLAVVTGTPAASPVDPAVPANAIVLARVTLPALAATVITGYITDLRNTQTGQQRLAASGGTFPCTSTTRPPSPYTGMKILETDTLREYAWSGSAWVPGPNYGAELTYTPVVTQGVGVGVTVSQSRYSKIGRRVVGSMALTVTGTGTSSSLIEITPPVTADDSALSIGSGYVIDTSASQIYHVVPYMNGATSIALIRQNDGAILFLGQSGLTQLASGDIISFTYTYESAS